MKVLLDSCVWGGALNTLRDAGHEVDWCGNWPRDPGDRQILMDQGVGDQFAQGQFRIQRVRAAERLVDDLVGGQHVHDIPDQALEP